MDTQKCSSKIEEINITRDMVEKKLTKLNPNKSPSLDGMHPKIVLETSSKITNALYDARQAYRNANYHYNGKLGI